MDLQLFNTLTRQKETFTQPDQSPVKMYSCGPTVYGFAHIGNLRTYVFSDLLRRTLAYNGFDVQHVMNSTDVGHLTDDADQGEDKVERQAQREAKSALELTRYYEEAFLQDLDALHITRPTQWLRATEHIQEQIALIQQLEAKGVTYRTNDGIYYDTSTFPRYGDFARLQTAGQQEGARVQVNTEKRHPTDFALWKFSPAQQQRQMEWDSPWGVGFPGWHVECSAMVMKAFGPTADIHTGGIDHIPVHHTNEIAQSEAVTGQPLARFWLHGEFLIIDEGRMGKSEGNALTLRTLGKKGLDPIAYRFWLLQTHYRSKLNFTWDALEAAQRGWQNLTAEIERWGALTPGEIHSDYEQRFHEAINNDLDLPKSLVITWELIRSDIAANDKLATLLRFDQVLGLGIESIRPVTLPDELNALLQERESARQAKEWEKADALRQQLLDAGYVVEDRPKGAFVRRA